MAADNLIISVVICTSGFRLDSLRRALRSLAGQDINKDNFEVLVIENNNTPCGLLGGVVTEFKGALKLNYSFIRFCNLSKARNLGARLSRADYIAYLDDDAEATPHWVGAITEGIRQFSPDICGGPYTIFYNSRKPDWFKDSYSGLAPYDRGQEAKMLQGNELLSGGNLILRKSLVTELGGFREDLGMRAGRAGAGEETFLMRLAWLKNPGLRVFYLPGARVRHEVRPDRMKLGGIILRAWLYYGDNAYMGCLFNGYPHAGKAVKSFISEAINLFFVSLRWLSVFIKCILKNDRVLWRQYTVEKALKPLGHLSSSVTLLRVSFSQKNTLRIDNAEKLPG